MSSTYKLLVSVKCMYVILPGKVITVKCLFVVFLFTQYLPPGKIIPMYDVVVYIVLISYFYNVVVPEYSELTPSVAPFPVIMFYRGMKTLKYGNNVLRT